MMISETSSETETGTRCTAASYDSSQCGGVPSRRNSHRIAGKRAWSVNRSRPAANPPDVRFVRLLQIQEIIVCRPRPLASARVDCAHPPTPGLCSYKVEAESCSLGTRDRVIRPHRARRGVVGELPRLTPGSINFIGDCTWHCGPTQWRGPRVEIEHRQVLRGDE